MPFYGYTTAAEFDDVPFRDASTLIRWHVNDNDFIREGTTVATIRCANTDYTLKICFPALIEKKLISEGETIKSSEDILKWNADGDSIPYGKQHFKIQNTA
jgi:pyruvate/2-oxoglutarate dehydrogenase complex dihydrolipoamide acyltransferase (E2) component